MTKGRQEVARPKVVIATMLPFKLMKPRLLLISALTILSTASAADLRFTIRPSLQFKSTTTAHLSWQTAVVGDATAVAYGRTPQLGQRAEGLFRSEATTAKLRDLEPQSSYYYKIGVKQGTTWQFSPVYEFSTAVNYTLTPTSGAAVSDSAKSLLDQIPVRQGYAVLLGNANTLTPMAIDLARSSDLVTFVYDDNAQRVSQVRSTLNDTGVYGLRVTVSHVESLENLPLTSCFANVVIHDAPKHAEEAKRLVQPQGWVVHGTTTWQHPPLEGAGSWAYQYGDPGNTANSNETLSGARATDDMMVQWLGRPGADFGIDRQSRMPAPLAVGGRLFHQGMNRLIALNAYNGAVLWGMEAPDLRRLNMPRDTSNWCADSDHLYLAIGERAWVMEAQTGERKQTLSVPKATGNEDWSYLAAHEGLLLGSSVKANTIYTEYWGGDKWFDEKSGKGTGKVCSDRLFAYALGQDTPLWVYKKGLILNPSIALDTELGRLVFVESRHSDVLASKERQVTDPKLWLDQYLVSVDIKTGKVLWEKPIDTEDGVITFYLQAHAKGIVITVSNTQYHFYCFDRDNGNLRWKRSNPWPDDHHSGFIQHPVIVNDTIFVQPNGYAMDTGEIITRKVGERSGCHTYIGTSKALIYRGANRRIAMWDQESETVSTWTRLRPSCWLSFIAADGMLLVPEGGGGCSCGGWMETSIGFAPKTMLGLNQ